MMVTSIIDAAKKLHQASQNKNIETMFLVAIARGGHSCLADELPPGVVVVDAPAVGFKQFLESQGRGAGKEVPNESLKTTSPGSD